MILVEGEAAVNTERLFKAAKGLPISSLLFNDVTLPNTWSPAEVFSSFSNLSLLTIDIRHRNPDWNWMKELARGVPTSLQHLDVLISSD